MHDIDLSRIAVVGPSGSGKTTVGRTLAELLGHPFVELDAIHWQPDWQALDARTMRAQVGRHVCGDHWIVDGGYTSKLNNLVLERATVVIWLDLPARIVFPRLVARTLRRILRREVLFNGNRETFRLAFLDADGLLNTFATHPVRRARNERRFAGDGSYSAKTLRLRRPRDIRRFLAGCEDQPGAFTPG